MKQFFCFTCLILLLFSLTVTSEAFSPKFPEMNTLIQLAKFEKSIKKTSSSDNDLTFKRPREKDETYSLFTSKTAQIISQFANYIGNEGKVDPSASYGISSFILQDSLNTFTQNSNTPLWLKRTDISFSLDATWATSYNISSIQPISTGENSTLFTQIGFKNTGELGKSANLSLGLRSMNEKKTTMWGINTFYDPNFEYGHERVGLGIEYFTTFTEIRVNSYLPLSNAIENKKTALYEKAVKGHDIEFAYILPRAQWAKFYLKGYMWEQSLNNDTLDFSLSTSLQLTPRFSFTLGINGNYSDRNQLYGTIMYDFFANKRSAFANKTENDKESTIESKRLEKVRRENDIIVETD